MDRQGVLHFINDILELRDAYSFSVTSWIRTPTRNKLVGGKPNSKHLSGFGIDIVLDEEENKGQFLASVKSWGLKYLDEKDHIHIQI